MRTIQADQTWTLLDAVVTETIGDTYKLAHPYKSHTWEIKLGESSPGAIVVALQGSLDGTNWYDLDTYNVVADTMRHIANKPSLYVRANLTTLSGGGSPVPSITVRYIPSTD